jgi:hypothetical protein
LVEIDDSLGRSDGSRPGLRKFKPRSLDAVAIATFQPLGFTSEDRRLVHARVFEEDLVLKPGSPSRRPTARRCEPWRIDPVRGST